MWFFAQTIFWFVGFLVSVLLFLVGLFGFALGVVAFLFALAQGDPIFVHTMVETDIGPVIKVNVMHAAAICSDTAFVIGSQPAYDLFVFAFGCVKVHRAARGVIAWFARACNACAGAMGGDDLHRSELLPDL